MFTCIASYGHAGAGGMHGRWEEEVTGNTSEEILADARRKIPVTRDYISTIRTKDGKIIWSETKLPGKRLQWRLDALKAAGIPRK